MTQDKKVELGKAVADLKAFLHDAENLISNDEVDSVDFNLLVQKTRKLTDLCEASAVGGKATPPAPAVTHPPTPSGPAKAEHTGDQSKAKPK